MGGPPPGFSGATDPVELAEAIEGFARTLPLGGPKRRVTKEVEAWATATERNLHAPELFVAAQEQVPARAQQAA
jgi:hypothetical protein